jgi:hypothetical protein
VQSTSHRRLGVVSHIRTIMDTPELEYSYSLATYQDGKLPGLRATGPPTQQIQYLTSLRERDREGGCTLAALQTNRLGISWMPEGVGGLAGEWWRAQERDRDMGTATGHYMVKVIADGSNDGPKQQVRGQR